MMGIDVMMMGIDDESINDNNMMVII